MKKLLLVGVLVLSALTFANDVDYETLNGEDVEYDYVTDTFYYEDSTLEVEEDVFREDETIPVDKDDVIFD